MDDKDGDQQNFRTPLLTPRVSDSNRTQDHPNSDNSLPQTQCMTDLTHQLEQAVNLHYSSNNNDYETESESDVSDQQPTEATDDGILPNELPKDTVEATIDMSFNHQPSQDRDDICCPTQDVEPCSENFSGIISDTDDIYVAKPLDSSTLVCRESYCVPYLDEDDENNEISLMKQTLTTTTTTITSEYAEPKKHKNDVGHIMISYNHSTRATCQKIAQALKNNNYIVWIDQDNISGDILTSMASAIENAFVVLMAINEQYYQSRYCRLEAEYSVERNKPSIPMLMQPGYKAAGWLGIINGSKLHIDFNKFSFEDAFALLVREIESIRISLGIDGFDQTSISSYASNSHSITTMSSSWNSYQNINEWNADDVIEWLNREKLEVFQNALMGFTGATLWQLYKIKFDSASDYYRTVEALLPPTVPLRLFYNLTFNAAIESLFASSNQSMRR